MTVPTGTPAASSDGADDGPVTDEHVNDTVEQAPGGGRTVAEGPDGVGTGSGAPSVWQPPATGDVAVDEALQDLPGLLDQPLEAQVEGYTAVHVRLQDRLADLDG